MQFIPEAPAVEDGIEAEDQAHLLSNNPPEPTELDKAKEEVSLLDVEASAWFDGAPIENEKQAADVARILDAARKAKKKFDAVRMDETKPHREAEAAINATWKPLLTDLDRIAECAKKAQTGWLLKLEAEQKAEAERARKEAEAKIEEARRLAAAADGSLDAAKARDAAVQEAKQAERAASRAQNERAGAKGAGMDRSIGLRTTYHAKVVDRRKLLTHIATTDPAALTEFITDWAEKSVRTGRRGIPGVEVEERRGAA